MQPSEANDVPLSPISFLQRTGDVFREAAAIVDPDGPTGPRTWTGGEFRDRGDRIAGALRGVGIDVGDRVAVLSRNNPEMLQLHFGIPGSGAVIVPLNTRLAAAEYQHILDHSGARLLFVDAALAGQIFPVVAATAVEQVVLLDGPDAAGDVDGDLDGVGLAAWLDANDDGSGMVLPDDERQPIAINYTSGTTGSPKGVVSTHRGAYLNAMGQALQLQLRPDDVYLWTLPMFHCDGWCHTWGVTAVGARHVCLRDFEPARTLGLVASEHVTRFCGAPVVLNALAQLDPDERPDFDQAVVVATGGAPPAPSTIQAMQELGIEVVHLYGLTETYGPSLICEVQDDWSELPLDEYAERVSRQGVRTVNVQQVRVVDDELLDVAADGEAVGEIVVRSNTVMAGYFNDEAATDKALAGGWFHTGDLAVMHPDGYIQIRDRAKDVIISGGENVSSIEVENILLSHPAVSEAAIVAAPHSRWQEVPIGYVDLRRGAEATEAELIAYVRERLAHFKAPTAITFGPLPKTSTGKIQKYELRKMAGPSGSP